MALIMVGISIDVKPTLELAPLQFHCTSIAKLSVFHLKTHIIAFSGSTTI